jgi:hypothetical protein
VRFDLARYFALLCAPHLRIAAAAALTASTGPATCPMCNTAKYRGFVLPRIGADHAYARFALGWSVSSNKWTTPSQSPCLAFDGRTRTDLANVAVPPWWDSMTRLSASAPISFIFPTRRNWRLKLFAFRRPVPRCRRSHADSCESCKRTRRLEHLEGTRPADLCLLA